MLLVRYLKENSRGDFMVLQDSIEREKKGIDYIYSEQDKLILKEMLLLRER